MKKTTRFALLVLALVSTPSCFLFKLPKKGGGLTTYDIMLLGAGQPTRGPTKRIRFALLAPFEQVSNAARAELSAMGATQLESAGDDSVRFVVRDELQSGEDFVTLRQEGTILVLTFRVHRVPKQSSGPTAPENPGEQIRKKQQTIMGNPGSPQENQPGGVTGEDKDETDGAKARRKRIERLIVCLPGVGDVVDGDGAPKERQIITSVDREAVCRLRGATAAAASATDGGLPPTTTSTPSAAVPTAGTPPFPADAGKD
jgi:hypothetical protein